MNTNPRALPVFTRGNCREDVLRVSFPAFYSSIAAGLRDGLFASSQRIEGDTDAALIPFRQWCRSLAPLVACPVYERRET